MEQHKYIIVDSDGYELTTIFTSFTYLSEDEHFKKHIVPLLPSIAKSHNVGKAQWFSGCIEWV